MTSPASNEERLSLGIDFRSTEAGEVEIFAISRPDEVVRSWDQVLWIDDGLPADGPEQVLAGLCDGTRPRHREIPITMRVRRAGEELTVKVRWLDRISDGAAVVAPAADGPTLEESVSTSALESHNEAPAVDSGMAPEPTDTSPSAATPTLLPNDIEPTFADLAELNRINQGLPPRSPFLQEFLRWERRSEVSYSALDPSYDPFR